MDIATINSNIDKLYSQKWVNLNTWYPVGLWVAEPEDASKIYTLLKNSNNSTSGFEANTIPNSYSNLQNIISVKNIPDAPTGMSTKTRVGLETINQPNASQIELSFYIEQDLSTWKFLQKWREKWLKVSFDNTSGIFSKALTTIQTINQEACPEGYLELKYVNIKNDGQLEELGLLKIFGLIPVNVPFVGSVGPGVSRQSDITTISCKFLTSNITYVDLKSKECIQFY